jgi:hypothetical protein
MKKKERSRLKQIGGNKTQVTFSAKGTFKGNIEVTNTGDFVSMSKGNKGTSAQGQGVVTTPPRKTTEEGKPVLRGCAVWSTDWQVSIS